MVKVVMAGGGTAGHVNPLLATAAQLREDGAEVVVLGTKAGLEADLVPPPVLCWWRFRVFLCRVAPRWRSSRCRLVFRCC